MTQLEHRFIQPDGRQVSYAEFGDRAGKPVIYCHGFPGSRLEARLADDAALGLGIRLIAPDRPGFGSSSFVADRRLSDWGRGLADLANGLALQHFHLIGVSGGAPYAMAAGLHLAERIERIAIVCGLGEMTGDHPTADMNLAEAASLEFYRRSPKIAFWSYLHVIGPLLRRSPELIFRILVGRSPLADRTVLKIPYVRDAIVASFSEAFREGSRGPAYELGLLTQPWGIDPSHLNVPVQLWHGDADHTVPEAMARRHASLLPDVRAHFIPGEGHFSLIVRYMREILASLTGKSQK